jgi:hypothetical protein
MHAGACGQAELVIPWPGGPPASLSAMYKVIGMEKLLFVFALMWTLCFFHVGKRRMDACWAEPTGAVFVGNLPSYR